MRLLTRTTRRVALTQAGERLLKTLGPAFDTIAAELASLSELREKPADHPRDHVRARGAQRPVARSGNAAA